MSGKLRYLYRAYRYRLSVDSAELRFLCSQLQPGQVAADVGCHKGAYTYWMRRRVGPQGAVFAFEPQPKQVEYLRNTFSAMNYDNVVVVPQAVSDRQGELELRTPAGSGLTHAATLERRAIHDPVFHAGQTTLVDVTTLDDFFANQDRKPNFIKIDVEGHESAVIAGANHVLATYRPTLLIECEARHRSDGNVFAVFEALQELGYEGSFFYRGGRRPLTEFDPGTHQPVRDTVTPLPRGYVNNFAFVPRHPLVACP